MRIKKFFQKQKGFTLVEMLISVFLFSLVVIMLMGSFSSFFSSYINSKRNQNDIENAQYVMGTMVKTIRTSRIIGDIGDITGFPLNIYDFSQLKCIQYDYDSVSKNIMYGEGLPADINAPDPESCNFEDIRDNNMNLLTYDGNIAEASISAVPSRGLKYGKVTIFFSIQSKGATSPVPIQMSTSLRSRANCIEGGKLSFVDASGNPIEKPISGSSYAINTFTEVGESWPMVNCSGVDFEYLVVGGGGGGGYGGGGGGGAGGLLTGTKKLPTGYILVKVGNGGEGGNEDRANGANGEDSLLDTIVAYGGGGGGGVNSAGSDGGSGGGAGCNSTSPGEVYEGYESQGNNGGEGGSSDPGVTGGGGGGAEEAGNDGDAEDRGFGGDGILSKISGYEITYAGGGGGADCTESDDIAEGGEGGGGDGQNNPGGSGGNNPEPGMPNTGGGGGGAADQGGEKVPGATGGSGIVMIKYPYFEYEE